MCRCQRVWNIQIEAVTDHVTWVQVTLAKHPEPNPVEDPSTAVPVARGRTPLNVAHHELTYVSFQLEHEISQFIKVSIFMRTVKLTSFRFHPTSDPEHQNLSQVAWG